MNEELDPRFNSAADQAKLQDFYQQAARALEISGSAETLTEALDQWELEREVTAELFDENQALGILLRQLDTAITMAESIVRQIEKDAGMFITQPTRDKIEKFRALIKNEEQRRAAVRQMIAEATERRNKNVQTH